MPRYEFSEGSSNKFWEIKLSGSQFTTTYGKIGTSGQTSLKTFKSDAEAKKEYDKLIAEVELFLPSGQIRGLMAEIEDGAAHFGVLDSREQKAKLGQLSPDQVTADELAGEKITAKLTRAPGNDAPIGGLKVVTATGWFAARPSGTEDVYKLYAESFRGPEQLAAIQAQAREIIASAIS